MKFLDAWDRRLGQWSEERFFLVLLTALALTVSMMVAFAALNLNRNFLTIACDTAAAQSAIVNTLHGNFFRDTAYDGPNLLGLHTTLTLLLVAPIYAVFPSPDTLFVLQVFGVYSTVIPLYLVACEMLGRVRTAALVAALALASPLLLHMAMGPFHAETWILPAVLWSCFFYRRNRPLGFWISFAFAVGCGEQAALIYLALGAAWWLCEDGLPWRRRYGTFALAGGFGWLVIALVMVSLIRGPGQHNLFAYNYSNWSINSAGGLAMAMVHEPVKVLGLLLQPDRWGHVGELVGFPLVLAFLSRRSLLLLAPFPFYFLMNDQEFFLYFHAYYYQFAFLAGAMGLIFFLARWDPATRLGTAVLGVTAAVALAVLCGAAGIYGGLGIGMDPTFSAVLHSAFARIPAEAAVYSPHRYSAYLSNRDDMVMGDLSEENLDFDAMLEAKFNTTDVHAREIDYIVCDLETDQCGWRQNGLAPETSKQRADNLNRLLQSGHWQVFWNQNNVGILKRVGGE